MRIYILFNPVVPDLETTWNYVILGQYLQLITTFIQNELQDFGAISQ